MKSYPKYKDSGIAWIGEVPEHWGILKLKYITEILSGVSPEILSPNMNGEIPYYKVDSINYDRFELDPPKHFISEEQAISENELILFPKRGAAIALNKVGIMSKKLSFDTNIMGLRIRTGKGMLLYLANVLKCISLIEIADTSTIPQINNKHIEPLEVPSPSLSEQTQIARFLDRKTAQIDTALDQHRQLLQLLREERAALINEAVTKGIDPEVAMKDSGVEWIGEVPGHWEVKKLKFELESLNNIRIPLSSVVRGNMKEKIYDYYGASGVIDKVDEYLFDENLILIGEDGANLITRSKRLVFMATGKYWVNNHAHILRPIYGNLRYYTELLETYDFSLWVSGSAQPKLTSEKLSNVLVLSPPVKEQHQIVQHIETHTTRIDREIAATEKEIALLEEYRQALIAEAVTGKIDVRDYPLD